MMMMVMMMMMMVMMMMMMMTMMMMMITIISFPSKSALEWVTRNRFSIPSIQSNSTCNVLVVHT